MGFWYLGTHTPWAANPRAGMVIPVAATWALLAILYAASVVAGLLLLLRRRYGRIGSALIQALQIPSLSALGISYTFVVGAAVLVELRWPGPETYLSWIAGSRFALFVGGKDVPAAFGVNALALALLLLTIPWPTSEARLESDVAS
jgi:hypothetical protein